MWTGAAFTGTGAGRRLARRALSLWRRKSWKNKRSLGAAPSSSHGYACLQQIPSQRQRSDCITVAFIRPEQQRMWVWSADYQLIIHHQSMNLALPQRAPFIIITITSSPSWLIEHDPQTWLSIIFSDLNHENQITFVNVIRFQIFCLISSLFPLEDALTPSEHHYINKPVMKSSFVGHKSKNSRQNIA